MKRGLPMKAPRFSPLLLAMLISALCVPASADLVDDLPDAMNLDAPGLPAGRVAVSAEAEALVGSLYALPTATTTVAPQFWERVGSVLGSLEAWKHRDADRPGRRLALGLGIQELLWRVREAVELDPAKTGVWGPVWVRLEELRASARGDSDGRLKEFVGRFVTGPAHPDWRVLKKAAAGFDARVRRKGEDWVKKADELWTLCEEVESKESRALQDWEKKNLTRYRDEGLSERYAGVLGSGRRRLADWRLSTVWGNLYPRALLGWDPGLKEELGLKALPIRLHWAEVGLLLVGGGAAQAPSWSLTGSGSPGSAAVPEAGRSFEKGVFLVSDGKARDALGPLEAAVAFEPGNGRYRAWLGSAYCEAGMPDKALEHLAKAAALGERWMFFIGGSHLAKGDVETALVAFELASRDSAPQERDEDQRRLAREELEALRGYKDAMSSGKAATEAGRYLDALESYRKASSLGHSPALQERARAARAAPESALKTRTRLGFAGLSAAVLVLGWFLFRGAIRWRPSAGAEGLERTSPSVGQGSEARDHPRSAEAAPGRTEAPSSVPAGLADPPEDADWYRCFLAGTWSHDPGSVPFPEVVPEMKALPALFGRKKASQWAGFLAERRYRAERWSCDEYSEALRQAILKDAPFSWVAALYAEIQSNLPPSVGKELH
ncbi:MAG: hypothetical protein WC943_11190 [Elusimicrobiota bacterium]|jgi:tetratricopeptide (TPR) repeat protein